MDKIKLEVDIQPINKNEYQGTIAFENWDSCLNYYYENLLTQKTSHIKMNGFRNRKMVPDILLELKYPDLFETFKKYMFCGLYWPHYVSKTNLAI